MPFNRLPAFSLKYAPLSICAIAGALNRTRVKGWLPLGILFPGNLGAREILDEPGAAWLPELTLDSWNAPVILSLTAMEYYHIILI